MNKLNPQLGQSSFIQWAEMAKQDPEKFYIEYIKFSNADLLIVQDVDNFSSEKFKHRVNLIQRKYKDNPFGLKCMLGLESVFVSLWISVQLELLYLLVKLKVLTP